MRSKRDCIGRIPGVVVIAILMARILLGEAIAGAGGDNKASLPNFLGEPRSVNIAAPIGAVSDSLPIIVAPGRHGVEPKLTLIYSSMGGQGKLGAGWDIEIGRIERWRGDGVPPASSADSDTFLFSLAGAGGQLKDTGSGVYRAKMESLYREFRRRGEAWEMWDGEGNLHRFGGADDGNSRIAGEIWLLDLVRDKNGNTIEYFYDRGSRPNGALYPSMIRYTGHEPTDTPGENLVVFQYEDRPDTRSSYLNGRREEMDRRLSALSVSAGGSLVRRYEFTYSQDPLNGQSQLARVTLAGADGTSKIVLRSITYGSRALRPVQENGGALPTFLAVYDSDAEAHVESGARVVDVNGDGFADAMDNGTNVWLGDGQGGFTWSQAWSTSLQAAQVQFVGTHGMDLGVRLLDVDGDMRPDLFIASPSRREIWLNTGTGWVRNESWTTSLGSITSQAIAYADGDYLNGPPSGCSPPHCSSLSNPLPGSNCLPPHCTGSDTDPPDCVPPHCSDQDVDGCLPDHCGLSDLQYTQLTQEVFSLVDISDDKSDSKGVQLADVNGDGRLDILWSMSRNVEVFWMMSRVPVRVRGVFLNTGSGWTRSEILTDALSAFSGEFVTNTETQGYDVLDVNGDGLADIVRTMEGQSLAVYVGTGSGWVLDTEYTTSLQANGITSIGADRKGLGLMPVDFNDDGLIDYVKSNQVTTMAYRNTGRGWEAVPSQPQGGAPSMTALLQEYAGRNMIFSTSDGKATGVTLADIDGDGLTDFVVAKSVDAASQPAYLWMSLSSQVRSGLLVEATSGIGETTVVEWGSSSRFDNRREEGGVVVQGLPVPMPVPTALTRRDGRGNSWSSAMAYAGGLFEARQFRGFRQSRETLPSGLQTVRRYLQTEGLSGQFDLEEGVAPGPTVLARRSIVYEQREAPSAPGITQFFTQQIDEETIDPGGTRRTRVVNAVDAYLNRVSVYRDPDVDTAGDETTTEFTWAMNPSAGIWSLLARMRVVYPNDAVATENTMIYDGLPVGTADKGQLSEVRDLVELGVTVSKFMEYDQYGNVIRLTDRTGQVSEYGYDESTATFRTWARDPEGRETLCAYDPGLGLPLVDRDPTGNTTIKTYDAFGRILEERLPGDEMSPYGTRTRVYSPLGNATAQYVQVAETETPDSAHVLETRSYFDGFGQLYRVEKEGPAGRPVVTRSEFDDASNAVATSRPFLLGDEPLWTVFERDPLGRPTRIVEPDGIAMTMNYGGLRTTFVDRRGATAVFVKNGDGQLTEVHKWVDGQEQVTRYIYDPLGRLVSTIDALGSETRIGYDGLGRRVHFEDPNAGTYRYTYDAENRLTSQQGPDGGVTSFVMNGAGDLLRKEFPDGTSTEYTYGQQGQGNGAGRIVGIRDAAGLVEIAYDPRGNVVQRKRTITEETGMSLPGRAKFPRTYVTGYSYDSMGRIRQVTYPDGFAAIYEYDTGGNLARVTNGRGEAIADLGGYTAAGQLGTVAFGNGVLSHFQYNSMQQMTHILTRAGDGHSLQDLQYTYDAGSNILAISDQVNDASQSFEYDLAGRLVQAQGAYGEESYQYDAIGNLVRKGRVLFTVDPDHPQRVIRESKLSLRGRLLRAFDKELSYDDLGNVIRHGSTQYEYDAENHLVRARGPGGALRVENCYDSAGQRVFQRAGQNVKVFIDDIYEEGQGVASRHVMAGPLLVATVVTPLKAVELIEEAPPPLLGSCGPWKRLKAALQPGVWAALLAGSLSVCLFALARCVARRGDIGRFVEQLSEIGARMRMSPLRAGFVLAFVPVFLVVSSRAVQGEIRVSAGAKAQPPVRETCYYYHSNHLGSVNLVTDAKSRVVAKRDYRPYGEPFKWAGHMAGAGELAITFDGQRYDDESGLYYFNARHYDPALGRFLASDTKVPDPTDPRSLHRYAFAAGNPIRYVDPTGHGFWEWFAAIFIMIIAAVIAIVTFGAGLSLGFACLGGILLMTIGAAFAGGVVFAALALSQGTDPLSADFFKAAAAGMIVGAAIGAGFACLPSALASFGSLASGFMGVLASLGANAMVGAMFGAVQSTIINFVNGNGPDAMLSAELGISIAISAGLAMLSTGVLGPLKTATVLATPAKALSFLLKAGAIAGLFHAGFTGKSVMQSMFGAVKSGMDAFATSTLQAYQFTGQLLSGSSPIPTWAIVGASPGGGAWSRNEDMSGLFATMPLAP
ncbi:MAG: RHS repeat-associated core domain-containing protein [Syntrophobacteraceae bacterium]